MKAHTLHSITNYLANSSRLINRKCEWPLTLSLFNVLFLNSPVVPVDGMYLFTVHILSNAQTLGRCVLQVDGVGIADSRQVDDMTADRSFELTVTLELTSGQSVDVLNVAGFSLHGSFEVLMHTWFTGHLAKAN